MENLHILGNEFYKKDLLDEAINTYSELIKNNYKLNIIYSNRSACYLKQKNYKKSLDDALKSIEINMKNAVAWGRVGYSYKALKMYDEALTAFRIAYNIEKKRIYLNEINFFMDKKINKTNIFNLLLNNNDLFNKLKDLKTEILTTNPKEIFENKKIINFINETISKL